MGFLPFLFAMLWMGQSCWSLWEFWKARKIRKCLYATYCIHHWPCRKIATKVKVAWHRLAQMDALLVTAWPLFCVLGLVFLSYTRMFYHNGGVESVECKIMSTVQSPWSPVDFSHPGSWWHCGMPWKGRRGWCTFQIHSIFCTWRRRVRCWE